MEIEDAIHTALLTLKEGYEGEKYFIRNSFLFYDNKQWIIITL